MRAVPFGRFGARRFGWLGQATYNFRMSVGLSQGPHGNSPRESRDKHRPQKLEERADGAHDAGFSAGVSPGEKTRCGSRLPFARFN